MRKYIFTAIFACLAVFGVLAQERGLDVIARDLGPQVQIGKQWAVFIAIDTYKEWPTLANPVKDAREIRDILTEHYYIDEVQELYNDSATAANIRRLFTNLREEVGINDSVFVFYAGHGNLEDITNSGSWIPTDGGIDVFAQMNWLPNTQVRNMLTSLPARHVFLVADACFSGDILDLSRGAPPEINSEYYRRGYSRVSRQVLTSGASETVPDTSEFAMRLKSSLRRAEGSYIDPQYIFMNVREVRSTQPLLGAIRESEHQEGGTFLFFRKAAPGIPTPEPAPALIAAPVTPVLPVPEVTPVPPATEQVRPVEPPSPSPQVREEGSGTIASYNTSWGVGALFGSSFSTPLVTAGITARLPMPFVPYTFFDAGFDAGFVDSANNSDAYYSLYPFAHYNVFLPLMDNKITPYIGAGAGYMIANYTFPSESVKANIFAFDGAAGLKLFGFIDIVYSLRVSSAGMSGRLAAGVFYSFGN